MRKALVFLVAAVVIGVGVWIISRPPKPPEPAPPVETGRMTVDELESLIRRKNLAIGRLENSELEGARIEDCVADFERLATDWPGERVAVQNLVIARLLEINKTSTPADRQQAISRAQAAVDRLLELAPDREVPHVLAGRLAVIEEDDETAYREFESAARFNPDNAATWYEIREAWNEFDSSVPDPVRIGLHKTFELAPDNLWVLRDWWTVQLKDKDPEIADTLHAARPVLEVIAGRIQQLSGYDVLERLQAAQDQAAAGDWQSLQFSLMTLWNLVKGDDAAHSDRNHITRHLLDFVVSDFSEEFYAQAPPLPTLEQQHAVPEFDRMETTLEGIQADDLVDGILEDFDLDGRLDLCLLESGRVVVLSRAPTGEDWLPIASADVSGEWRGMLLIDVDDDRVAPLAASNEQSARVECHRADLDVVLFGANGLQVLLNTADQDSGQRSLTSVDAFGDTPMQDVRSCLPLDADMDGDLDLLVSGGGGVQLLSNRGNASFRVRDDSILGLPEGMLIASATAVDFDRDVDLDVLFAAADGSLNMLENLRHGNLRWREMVLSGPAIQDASAVDVVDCDGNVSWDVVTGSPSSLNLDLTRTVVRGDVQPVEKHELHVASNHLTVADFDNDSLDEILCWSDSEVTLVDCALDGELSPFNGTDLGPPADVQVVDVDYGDIDDDGDLDVVVLTQNGVEFFNNALDPPSGWIDIALVAEQADEERGISSKRVNHYGLGSLIEMKVGSAYREQIVRRPRTHFGLDSLGDVDVLRVVWTNGVPSNLLQPEPNQAICEVQTLGTSCPYLYTWNGDRHVFVTDLCWAAPLGLRDSQGQVVPHRDWEYVRIDGRMLVPEDGLYRLQVTEELWEATYFDQVRLVAIDHPADISIYSNEKVGPPEMAEYRIHTVREPQSLVSARDQRGRDVLAEIAAPDDVYLRLQDDRIAQGYTDETYLELELGELREPRQIMLYLTGWLYPTDANINAALAENPDLPGPQPPSIQVPSASGEWIEAVPYMGFPGGKTKTIAVDISNIFPTDDYRLRIVTSMELFWDHIFFTVDESPADFVERELELVSADLHFRGVSEFTPHPHNGPDRYHYDRVAPPRFAPMGGAFTRFGDVRELITTPDDRLLVIGCGDECTLEFAVPSEPLPEGWTRDFILHSVGWDKDANLHTVYGQTVEPMPYRNMQSYPYPPDSFPGSPEYDEYLRTYQTRRFSDTYFRRALQ